MASLVSVKLSNSNFLIQKLQIHPLIRSAQLLHHIEGDMPSKVVQRENKDAENPDYAIWINNYYFLTSWLLGTMSEEVHSLVIGCNTTRQIWKCLEEHVLASIKEREIQLKNQLATIKVNLSLDEFIRRFKHTCDSLAAIQQPLENLDKVFQLSRVLRSCYQPYNLVVLSKPHIHLSTIISWVYKALSSINFRRRRKI